MLMKRWVFVAVFLWSAPDLMAASDWATFKGDAQRSGHIRQDVDVSRLQLEWQHRLPTAVVSSPVAADGQAFVGGENGNLYAFDLIGQRLQWIYPSGDAISSTPAVAEGLVYFLSLDGTFHAVSAESGSLIWSFQTQGEERFSARHYMGIKQTDDPIRDPWDFYLSSPLVAEGRVYVGSSDRHLYALDAESGELLWAYRTAGLVHASPALAGDTLVIGDWHGVVHALDAVTGEHRWQFTTEQDLQLSQWLGIQSSPVIDGDRVYVGSRDSYLYALSLADGQTLWRYAMPHRSWVVATPSIDDKLVYLGSSQPGFILAIDKDSGEEVWRTATQVWSYSSPLVLGKHLISATMKGDILALASETGEVLWQFQSDSARADHFGIIDGQTGGFDYQAMSITTLHQSLYASMQYILHLGGFLSSPAWHQDRLILVTTDGQLVVFGEPE